jgi:signal peptidase I
LQALGQRVDTLAVESRFGWKRPAAVAAAGAVAVLALLFAGRVSPALACEGAPEVPTRLVTVEQGAMRPLFLPDDVVALVDLGPGGLRRGDVVALDPTGWSGIDGAGPFVMRVIALAGDQVQLRDGRVVVDGIDLTEPYVFGGEATNPDTAATPIWNIPAGQMFGLGDHRAIAADSRIYGPIPVASILGRVAYRCGPENRRGAIK